MKYKIDKEDVDSQENQDPELLDQGLAIAITGL